MFEVTETSFCSSSFFAPSRAIIEPHLLLFALHMWILLSIHLFYLLIIMNEEIFTELLLCTTQRGIVENIKIR